MVRRNKNKTRRADTSIIVEHDKSSSNGFEDPWTSIENSETVTAREMYYKFTPEEPRVNHYEKFKHKKQRISDGFDAKRVEIHNKVPRGTKRTRVNSEVVYNDSPAHRNSIKKMGRYGESIIDTVFADGTNTSRAHRIKIDGRKSPYSPKLAAVDDSENLEVVGSDDNNDFDNDEKSNDNEYVEHDVSILSDEESFAEDEEGDTEDEDEEENFLESLSEESDKDEEIIDDSISPNTDDSAVDVNLRDDQEAVVLQHQCGDTTPHPPDFDIFPFTDCDSFVTATRAFAWMVTPCDPQTFFKNFFQSNALIVKRDAPSYYGNLFSTERFVELIQNNYMEYGTNINIAEYKDGSRFTMNGAGRVYPNHLRDHIALGRSVQLVNPQTFDDRVWYLCEVLQEMFGCFVGANSYLTPSCSAGFAPHWDDIDAFLLQLEGKKYWKVYAPNSTSEELPRNPSGNFTDEDMKDRTPTLEGWLEAGDLLYIPRGFIHQAYTSSDVHSLHLTISSGRHWSFVDLMDKLVPEAITNLAANHSKIRKSLPIGMLDMGGVADIDYHLDEHFDKKWKAVLNRHMTLLCNTVMNLCDGGIDVMAREFMKTALPPRLTEEEKLLSVIGSQCDILHGKGMEFRPNTKVKFIRRHGQRLIFENDKDCYVVHRMANSRLYEERPEKNFQLSEELVSGFIALSESYPEWMSLSEMPDDMSAIQIQEFCHLLYYHGLIMVKRIPNRIKRKDKKGK